MKAIDFMPYAVVAGVLLVSLASPLFIGSDGWIVPIIVLPFALGYLVFDAMRKKRAGAARDER